MDIITEIQNKGTTPILIAACALIIMIIITIILIAARNRSAYDKASKMIRRGKVLSIDDFLSGWDNDKSDHPGCYIILAYKRRIIRNYLRYNEVYVGQSIHVRKRVHSHFTGHGNGEVYHLLRSDFNIYVCIVEFKQKDLNKAEKELIAGFMATDSLNITSGGSAERR